MKKVVGLILSVMMILALLPALPARADDTEEPVQVSSWAELENALYNGGAVVLTADVTASSGATGLNVSPGKPVTLDLNGHVIDRALTEAKENGGVITVHANGNLTIKDSNPTASHDPAITYTDPVKGETFSVTGGVITGGKNTDYGGGISSLGTVNILGGTITGNTAPSGGGIFSGTVATLTVNGGSVSGNTATEENGGAIWSAGKVSITDGSFSGNMTPASNNKQNGGAVWSSGQMEISGGYFSRNLGFYGGAVANACTTSTTTISGGTFTENKADYGGAVENLNECMMEIKGGSFCKNEAVSGGGGVANGFSKGWLHITGGDISNNTAGGDGGGIWMGKSDNTISGCTITGNVAKGVGGGIYLSGDTTMSGGTISGNKTEASESYQGGGGVYVREDRTFIMSGGQISENEAILDGGGVCVRGKFVLNGTDAVISGNKAKYGGGVYAENGGGQFEMSGGTISDNQGQYLAGGVYIHNKGKFTMTGGKICDNTVLQIDGKVDGQGGGVFVYSGGTFTMSGGTISGNKAPRQGGGVYSWTQIDLSGNPSITGNTVNGNPDDVFLRTSQNIKVTGNLSGIVGVNTDDTSFIITSGLSGNGNASNFESNVLGYTTGLNSDNEAVFKSVDYKIEIDQNIANGKADSNKATTTYKDTVTITLTPNTGYELDKLTVMQDDTEVLTSGSNNTYTFTMPAGDVKVTATFKLQTFTVKWVIDGKEEEEPYKYGAEPSYKNGTPTKKADAQYTYTFAGWTPEITKVTGDATYTATYNSTVNKYKVTFVNEDGTELQSGDLEYGKTPSYTGETPTKKADAQYTYTFAGWTPEITKVTGDATYKATYNSTVNKYKVTFVNDDGTVLQSSLVAYGEMPKYEGKEPEKPTTVQYSYSFAGWDPEITAVAGAATYTAKYDKMVTKHDLTFDLNGGTLNGQTGKITMTCEYGSKINLPGAPTKEGYKFLYWKGSEYAAGAEYKVDGPHDFIAEWEAETSPKTGDNGNAGLLAAIMGGSFLVIIVLITVGRKYLKKQR